MLIAWHIVQPRDPAVEATPIAIWKIYQAATPGLDHAFVATSRKTQGNYCPSLRTVPEQPVTAKGYLAIYVVGYLMVSLY